MQNPKPGYVLLLLLWLPAVAFSQIKQYAPARKASAKAPLAINAKRHTVNPVSLPFWDDFSFAKGHHADSLLWIVNDKVFVNDGQAINPPSINVATFDGYNENGRPYSTVALETGYGDTLESQPIRMADVPAQYRNAIYLSFFYQAGGNSEMPNPSDFLKLEFRSTAGWVEIHRFSIKSNANPALFYDTAIQVPPALLPGQPDYFHNQFQFRFTSFGRLSGSYDAWHIDYVYLNRRVANDKNTSISDRAVASPLSSILKNDYYAVPYSHFIQAPDSYLNTISLEFFNLKDTLFSQVVKYTSYFTIVTHTANNSEVTVEESEERDDILPLASRERSIREIHSLLDASDFMTGADSADVLVKVGLNSGDLNEDYYSRYIPIDFRFNDTIQQKFSLSSYYAYDDGVAEYSAGLAAQGNQLAYRFVMDPLITTNNILNGMFLYLPFTGGTVPETVRIFVFRDKAGKPDSSAVYSQTIPVTRSAENQFYKIDFTEGVIVQDTFYLGYEETVTGKPDRIRIGLDASHDTGNQMYYRNTVYHPWVQNTDLKGSLMIRPRFGDATVITGTEDKIAPVVIYPNPNSGEFYVKGHADHIQIISITGQPAGFSSENTEDATRIALQNPHRGVYLIRFRKGATISTGKLVVTGN